MYLSDITNRGNIPVLEKLMAFTQARHKVLAENIANIDTPGYKTKQLDPRLFQAALSRAIEDRDGGPGKSLDIPTTDQFRLDDQGHLVVTPTTCVSLKALIMRRGQLFRSWSQTISFAIMGS